MLVSLFTGSPSFQADAGWILSFPTTTLLISKACSGTGFFIIMCVLFGWHFTDKTQYHMLNLVLAVTVALFLSIFINALRIICLLQAHHWLFPLLPENYSAFAHMLIGVAAFLPTLIALNALLEFYGRKRNI